MAKAKDKVEDVTSQEEILETSDNNEEINSDLLSDDTEKQELDESQAVASAIVGKGKGVRMKYVCFLSPQAMAFSLGKKTIVLNGARVSDIVKHTGEKIRKGKWGITLVSADDWAELERKYGKTPLFRAGRIIAVNGKEDIKAIVKGAKGQKHGREQQNPEDDKNIKRVAE